MTLPGPTLAAIVREQTGVAWSRARALCSQGRVTVDGERCLDPALRVPAGAVVVVQQSAPKMRAGPLAQSVIVHVDRDFVAVDKPPGMLTVADEAGNRNTLADHLRTLLRRVDPRGADSPLGVVHRLDKDTSGVMAFARTAHAKRILAEQFRAHDVDRVYHAIVHGALEAARVESYITSDRGDGVRGSHGSFRGARNGAPMAGKRSVTHVRPIARLDGATLVECRLETGRQHQIRIHLSELGHPLVGERVYIRDYTGPIIEASRVMLHAHLLRFAHPRTRERMTFRRDDPDDMQRLVESLR